MRSPTETATPIEIASLWHLNLVSGDDVGRVCLRWLEEDLDRGCPDVAALAGEAGLAIRDIGPAFERALACVVGRSVEHDEAILRALHLYLAVALEEDLIEGVHQLLGQFANLSERRLVHNPRRAAHHPDGVYAAEELGLEYIYGTFYAFDDLHHLGVAEQETARAELRQELRNRVVELKDHLAVTLDT